MVLALEACSMEILLTLVFSSTPFLVACRSCPSIQPFLRSLRSPFFAHRSLKTLYVDDTEIESIEEVLEGCTALEDLNVGFTNVPKSLKPSYQRMIKAKSRSFTFFNLVLNMQKDRNASTLEKLSKLVEDGFEIDQRCHHKFQGDEGARRARSEATRKDDSTTVQ